MSRRKAGERCNRDVCPALDDLDIVDDLGQLWVRLGGELFSWLVSPITPKSAKAARTITFWFDGTSWRLSLHDRGRRSVSFLAGDSLTQVLETANQGLGYEVLKWMESKLK